MALTLTLSGEILNFDTRNLTKVGSGGEGSVYLLRHEGNSYAIKRYHHPTVERFEKLEAAIAAQPKNAVYVHGSNIVVQMAWPIGIVKENGKALGFAMPYVSSDDTMELDFFISPVLAKDQRHLEKPNLAMRLQIAQNLCSVVNALHEAGHYFIDFKPQNVKVYPRSLHVCLIDCDSYSISHDGQRYPATAYSPQFINPVALVNDLHPSKLGEEQDNWAIAVALFMLLNYDLHPYDGKAKPSIYVTAVDDFVRMGLYAYGWAQNPLVSPKPRSVHSLWPSEIRALFDRAFTDPSRSPSMNEWVDCIQVILQNKRIAKCDAYPKFVDHLRFSGFGCMQCSFDGRQRKAKKASSSETTQVRDTVLSGSAQVNQRSGRKGSGKPYIPTSPSNNKISIESASLWVLGLVSLALIIIGANSPSGDNNDIQQSSVTSASVNAQAQGTPDPQQIVVQQTAVSELEKVGFFGRYNTNCDAGVNYTDFQIHSFLLSPTGIVRWLISDNNGNKEWSIDRLVLMNDGASVIGFRGDVLIPDNGEQLGEVALDIRNNSFKILRYVDTRTKQAIILNGHYLASEEPTFSFPRCN